MEGSPVSAWATPVDSDIHALPPGVLDHIKSAVPVATSGWLPPNPA